MSSLLLGMILVTVFGILMLTIPGSAQSLDTSSDVNKMKALQVSDSTGSTLLGLNLGTSDSISSVTLTFFSDISDGSTVDISLKDDSDTEIGTGSTTVSPASSTVVISLSDTVTNAERRTLQLASITVT